MQNKPSEKTFPIDQAARERSVEIRHLQEIEGNPPNPDEVAMFEMFENEEWEHERRRAHILSSFQPLTTPEAAE